MSFIANGLLFATSLLLLWSTVRRFRRPIDAALLVSLMWLVLIPVQIVVFGTLHGYHETPRNNLYIATSLGNLSFVALQWFIDSGRFRRLSEAVKARLTPSDTKVSTDWHRLARYWWYGLAAVTVGIAIVHLWLMPRIPLFELIGGQTDFYQLSSDRENAAKLLSVPTMVKYVFQWNSSMLFPIVFVAAVLNRWRKLATFIGVVGLIYICAPMDKFPSFVFLFSAFVAIAVRDGKRAYSRIVIAGLVISLVPAYLITTSGPISLAIHHAVGAPVVQKPLPPDLAGAPPQGEVPVTSIAGVKLPGPVAGLMDLTLRRIAQGPSEVMYQWFSFFPEVHPFLDGAGWQPWKVLSGGYQNPANMVGLWAYYGKAGYRLSSISAYSSFLADGWAEFGYVGVVFACLWLFGFVVVIDFMRAFSDKPFCLACYAPSMLLVATSAPISGILAMTFSLGIALGPLICFGYLLSGRLRSAPASNVRSPVIDASARPT